MEFKEYMIKRKKSGKESLLTVLLYLAATVLSLIFIAALASFGGIGALLAAGCFYGAYKLSGKFNKEYEYIITGDSVDVDVIYNTTNRKRLITFSMKDVEVIASVKDTNHSQRLKGEYKKVIDATSGYDSNAVYFAVVEKAGRTLVKFEIPHSGLEVLKKFAPSKVIITD